MRPIGRAARNQLTQLRISGFPGGRWPLGAAGGAQGMSRRPLAARLGAHTTTGRVVVVADTNQYRLLADKHRLAGPPPGPTGLRWRPRPPRSTGHTPNEPRPAR